MYIIGMDLTSVRTSDEGPEFTPGALGTTSDGKIYKYLKYDTGAGSVAAVAGNVAYYYTLDGYKNATCTSDLSDSIEIGAGVLQAAPADGGFCWVQIKGAATITPALTGGADGDPLTPTGATDGTLDVVLNDAGSGFLAHICAYAGDISDKEIICDFPF